jgi:glycosyltransferase involved in cell wall biosynthesis
MILEKDFPPDIRVEKEIKSLLQAGHKITLLASSPTSRNQLYAWQGATIISYKMPKLIYKSSVAALKFEIYFNYWKKILELTFTQNSFDAIHLHDLPLAQIAHQFAQKYQIPFVLDLHENRPEIMKSYQHLNTFPGKYLSSIKAWRKYEEKFVKLADRVIVVTPEAADYYGQKYSLSPAEFTVVENYIDTEEFIKLAESSGRISKYSNKFLVVYFGDTGLRRGTMEILQVAKKLKSNPSVHFIIIGNSKEQQILEAAQQNLDLDNLDLLGWLPIEKAVEYIKISQIGLCPFHRNIHHDTTFANKMFQYLALGIPVLVSDCTAQKRVVQAEKCGMIFPAAKVDALQEKIEQMQNSADYHEWSQNAQTMTKSRYHWKNSAQKLREVYA